MLRKIGRALLILVGIVVSLVSGVFVYARTQSGEGRALKLLRSQVQKQLSGPVEIGALDGDLPSHLILHDVVIHDADGKEAVRIAELEVKLSVFSVVRKRIVLPLARATGVVVHARTLDDGRLNLAALARPSEHPEEKSERTIELSNVELEGDANWEGRGKTALQFAGGLTIAPDATTLRVASLQLQTREPGRAQLSVQGSFRFGEVIRLEGAALEVRSRDLAHLVGDEHLRGEWQARILAHGPLGRLHVEAEVTPPRGSLSARADLALKKTLEWSVELNGRDLDPAAAYENLPAARVAIQATGSGRDGRGTVDLARLTAEASGARAEAKGRVELGASLGGDVRAHVEAADLSKLEVPGLRGALRADAHVVRHGERLRVDAEVHGRSLALPQARVAQLEAHIHATDLTEGSVLVDARDLEAAPIALSTLQVRLDGYRRRLRLSVDGKGASSAVTLAAHGRMVRQNAASITLDRLGLTLRDLEVHTTAPAKLALGPELRVDGLSLASAEQRLSFSGRWDRVRDRIGAEIRGSRLDLAKLASLAKRRLPATSAALSVDVSGSMKQPVVIANIDGHTLAADPNLGERRLRLDARYRQERIAINGELTATGQRLAVQAELPTSLEGNHPVSLDAAADSRSLERLRGYLPGRLATLAGRAKIDVHLKGSTRRPELDAQLDGSKLALEPLAGSRLLAKIGYHQGRLSAEARADLAGHRPAGGVELAVALPIDLVSALQHPKRALAALQERAPLEVKLRLDGVVLQALPLLQLGIVVPLRAGVITGNLSATGTLRDPNLDVALTGNRLAAYDLRGMDTVVRARYRDGDATITVQGDVNRAPLFIAHASTHLVIARLLDGSPWKSAPIDAQLVVPAYDVAGGNVSGVAELHGSFARPWGRISARAEKLRYGGTRFNEARLEGDFDGQTVSASLWASQPEGGKLRADAALPLGKTSPINILVNAQKLELAAENLGALRKLDGQLDADLSLSGTRARPIVSGALHVRKGALGITGVPQLYQDITLDVAAREQTLELQKLTLSSSGGKLSAKGRLELAGLTPKRLDIDASVNRLPVAEGPVGAWIDAELAIHGERSSENVFQGAVTIKKGTAHLPKLAGGRKLQSTGDLKDVVFTDRKARRERARRKAAEKDEVPTTALLAARIPGPFHIRSPELMTDLDGELQVEVVGPVTRINGSIKSSGGWIELLGRRYDLDRVHLGFGGQNEIDPELDVRITREVTDAIIAVEVRGTAKHPKLAFSSDPPIYDESQIIGIIVSGDPGQSRTSDRSLDQKVVGALSGVIVGKLKDQIAPGLPIDVLKVDTGNDGYTGLASTRIEVGKYITESIYVSYVHQFGQLQIGTRQLNANEANVEWRFKRHFEIDTRFGDAGSGALDFFWTFRY